MPFASRKNNDSRKVIPSDVMPNLEVLHFNFYLHWHGGYRRNIGLEYLPSLRALRGQIVCEDMPVAESDAALAALRDACNAHPNHPTFDMPISYYHGFFA